MAYRERRVAISCGPVLGRYELVSRHLCHCGAHTRTEPSYTAGSPGRREHCVDLLDHPLAIGGVLLRSGTRNQHGTGQDGEYPKRQDLWAPQHSGSPIDGPRPPPDQKTRIKMIAITAPDTCSHSVCRESCGSDRPVACCQSLVA